MMYCCDKLSEFVREGDILFYSNADGIQFCIHGKPRFENDGDEYYDDMTETWEILCCPWCGRKLEELKE